MTIVPKGYVTARDMLDTIGRALFGREWTGDLEHRARHDLRTKEELEWMRTAPSIAAGGSWAQPENWNGPWVGFTLRKPDPDEGTEPYEAERLAHLRYEE